MDIPFPFDTRSSFQTRPDTANSAQRANFVLKTATDHLPDIFITEFFPFGRANYAQELLPTLRYLRKNGTRIVSSIGYPLFSDLNRLEEKNYGALFNVLLGFYDTFLIHTPQKLENPYFQDSIQTPLIAGTYRSLMKKLEKKIKYTGYVSPARMITGGTQLPPMNTALPTIIVSRGGGAVYPKLIIRAIEAHRLLKTRTRMIIACGPATTEKEMGLFRSFLKLQDHENIFLADHLDDLDEHLRTCDLSISLSGYNTSVQLMRFGTPSIIVPYESSVSKVSTNDQVARARLLQERFASSILSYDTLTPQILAKTIATQLSQPRPKPAPVAWFNGADTAAKFIVEDTVD